MRATDPSRSAQPIQAIINRSQKPQNLPGGTVFILIGVGSLVGAYYVHLKRR